MKLNKNKVRATVCAFVLFVASINMAGFVANIRVFATQICDPSATTIDAAVCMQDINDSIIESMILDEQYQLIDARDGRTYYIVKLQDGNVWMSQNLKLFLKDSTALTSETSDLNDATSAAYQNGYSVEGGIIKWLPSSTTINFNNVTVSGWVDSATAPYSASRNEDTSAGHESYGNYYNWSSSIASNDSSSFSDSTLEDVAKNPQNSICPKRWRLPTISNQSAEEEGTTNEFARLNQLYNNGSLDTDEGLLSAPLYLVRAGYIRFGLHSLDISGNYWSDTVNDADTAFFLGFHSSTVIPSGSDTYNYKSYGRSIRCVARAGFSADPSEPDGEDDNSIAAPDTGANFKTTEPVNGSAPILEFIISSVAAAIGFILLSKHSKKDSK